jgi:hypothetical protein
MHEGRSSSRFDGAIHYQDRLIQGARLKNIICAGWPAGTVSFAGS